MDDLRRRSLAVAAGDELNNVIAPFWLSLKDSRGGFFGAAWGRHRPIDGWPKSTVAQMRILWFFSKLAECSHLEEHRDAALHAHAFVETALFDRSGGGVIWSAYPDGAPCDGQKHLYAHAFAILALSAHHKAIGGSQALEEAIALFRLVEQKFSSHSLGYLEAYGVNWTPSENQQMGMAEAAHSFNAHLHLLEGYFELWTAWPDASLRECIENLIALAAHRFFDEETSSFIQFFSKTWHALPASRSFGHDIEAAWMLSEYAAGVGSQHIVKTREIQVQVSRDVLGQAVRADGSLIVGRRIDGSLDKRRVWWVQAEGLIGFLRAYGETGEHQFLSATEKLWGFIKNRLSDPIGGDWAAEPRSLFSRRRRRADEWKCPYHNGRACFELASSQTLDGARSADD